MNDYNWKNDPLLKNMDNKKLEFLTKVLNEAQTKPQNELIPFLLKITSPTDSNNVSFNDSETNLIMRVLKERMSPAEKKKIDMVYKLSKMINAKRK